MTEEPVPIEPLPVGGPPLVGEVVDFDEGRGTGIVQVGERQAAFHCTAITDGSRQIEVGTVVAVGLRAGRLGRVEARWVRPLPGVGGRGATVRVGRARTVGQRDGPPSPGSASRLPGPTSPGEGSDATPPSGIPVAAASSPDREPVERQPSSAD